MEFKDTEVWGFRHALYGMRMPMQSWAKADSKYIHDPVEKGFVIGNADMNLAHRLIKGGSEHCKFLRMIHVGVVVVAPRYIWSELDTYHFNTKNSESTMHRLLADKNPLTRDNFQLVDKELDLYDDEISFINLLKIEYQKPSVDKHRLLRIAKAKLPEGFLQARMLDTNYAELRNMYFQRRNHRLPEWNTDFVNWIKTLPYAEELIMYEGDVDEK